MKNYGVFYIVLFILFAISVTNIQAQEKIGVEEYMDFSTPHPYPFISGSDEPSWIDVVSYPDASFIKIHFSKFNLAPGDKVVVRSPNHTESYEFTDRGNWKGNSGTFYATRIMGDTAFVELYTSGEKSGYGYEIDHFVRGFPVDYIGDVPDYEFVCGSEDWENAQCYSGTMYDKARPVVRLFIGSSACTGWLLGSSGHLVTNEHCITSQADADSTDVEFMGEGACGDNCDSWGGCPGSIWTGALTYINDSANLDYALLKIDGDPQLTYGYLQWRYDLVPVGEEIFIPQHPNAWGKKISYSSDMDSGGTCEVVSNVETVCSGGSGDIGYWCDTAGGSSGSPVISTTDYLVVGLHHCKGAALDCGDPNRSVRPGEVWDDIINNVAPGDLPADACVGDGCGTCSAPSAPSGLTITAFCDPMELSWNAVSGATGYNIYRKDGSCGGTYTLERSGVTTTIYKDHQVVLGNTYAYIIRAYSGTVDCESTDSNCVSGTASFPPSAAPTNSGPVCLGSPVTLYANASGGDLPYSFGWDMGDSSGSSSSENPVYTYAFAGSFSACVQLTSDPTGCGSDIQCTTVVVESYPSSPTIDSITDNDSCVQSGVTITFSGTASYFDLWVDGVETATNIASPYSYNPGDMASHNYEIYAYNGSCFTSSGITSATDADNTPSVPVISGITDDDPAVQSGVTITFSGSASSFDLWMDGAEVATNITSPYGYNPGDTASHSYIVRAVEGTCFSYSLATSATDEEVVTSVGEVPDNDDVPGAGTTAFKSGDDIVFSHDAATDATHYNLYRGTIASLQLAIYDHNVRANTADACSGDSSSDYLLDDTGVLIDGNNYYYLIAGNNTVCEGSLGDDSANVDRPLSTDNCGLSLCP